MCALPEEFPREHLVGAQHACPRVPDDREHKEVVPRLIINGPWIPDSGELLFVTLAFFTAGLRAYLMHRLKNC